MKKNIIIFILLCIVIPNMALYAAGESQTEQILKTAVPIPGVAEGELAKKGEFFVDSYFEPSEVVQGSRPGRWREVTNRFGYKYRNIQGYATVSQWRRFDVNNYTGHFGSYINFPSSYVHAEVGWGWDTTYMYRFQSVVEYGHKIKGGLYGDLGYTYRNYATNDSYMVYPGLTYYFGHNYLSTNYGMSLIESRGVAHFGTLKGSFAITKRLSWLLGAAVGRRLYDIYERPARKQFGYIIFTGLNFDLCQWLSARVGCSYGTEKPSFIKRSTYVSLSAKF